MGRGCTDGTGCLPTAPQLLLVHPQAGSLSCLYRNDSGSRNLGALLTHCSVCVVKESQPSIFLQEIQGPFVWVPASGRAEVDGTPLPRCPRKQGWLWWMFAGVQRALENAGSQGLPSSWQAQLPHACMGKYWQLPLKCFSSPRSERHSAALPCYFKCNSEKHSSFSLHYIVGVDGGGRSSAQGWVFPHWCQHWVPG